MARTVAALVTVVMLSVLLGSGCGSGSSRSYANPSCPAVLNLVSSGPPESWKTVGEWLSALVAVAPSGGRLGTLTSRLESDVQSLTPDLNPGSASYRAYQNDYLADVAQIQHYCNH